MINLFRNIWFKRNSDNRVSINPQEQAALLIDVLEQAKSVLKHYSIPDPTNQYVDLMLMPSIIDEAIEMLRHGSVGNKDFLLDFEAIKHRRR